MKEKRQGKVIQISSILGFRGTVFSNGYVERLLKGELQMYARELLKKKWERPLCEISECDFKPAYKALTNVGLLNF